MKHANGRLRTIFRRAAVAAMLLAGAAVSYAGIRVATVKGEVSVRRGASETWTAVAPGDVLRPEDSIRLGEGAAATVTVEGVAGAAGQDEPGGSVRRIDLPPMVIVDIADLRKMTRGDLLMKLAMEDIRSAPKPAEGDREGTETSKTTTTRAGDRESAPTGPVEPGPVNGLRLNGAKVLYDNGFYGSCVLRSREVLRLEPRLAARIDSRLLMADALEKMRLNEEAYGVYRSLEGEKLSAPEKTLVEKKLREMRDPAGPKK